MRRRAMPLVVGVAVLVLALASGFGGTGGGGGGGGGARAASDVSAAGGPPPPPAPPPPAAGGKAAKPSAKEAADRKERDADRELAIDPNDLLPTLDTPHATWADAAAQAELKGAARLPYERAMRLSTPKLATCDEVEAELKLLSTSPFGRGKFKEVFVGDFRGQWVVVKMPIVNRVNGGRGVPALEGKSEEEREAYVKHATEQFSNELVDELIGIQFLSSQIAANRSLLKDIHKEHVRPDFHLQSAVNAPALPVARYIGGCVGDEYGVNQLALQEGPFLRVDVLAAKPPPRLPWPARLQIVLNIFRAHLHFDRLQLIQCGWAPHQMGVDAFLHVYTFDFAEVVQYDDEPIGAHRECYEHEQCGDEAFKCLRNIPNAELYDEMRCDYKTHRCRGVTLATPVLFLCSTLFKDYLLRDDFDLPQGLQERLWQISIKCLDPSISTRPSIGRVAAWVQQAQADYRGHDLLYASRVDIYNQMQNLIDLSVSLKATRQCGKHVHC